MTPVFSASFSGLFKSFFDVLDTDSLDGTTVLIAATGGSARHSLALEYAVRPLPAYLRAAVVPTGVFAATADFGDGAAAQTLDRRIDRAAAEFAGLVTGSGRASGDRPAPRPDAFDHPVDFATLLGRAGAEQ